MPAARRRRAYESPLRAEQLDRTRERIIEAAIDLVRDEAGEKLTVRLVAARAGVSVPTAYRHFPDPDALLEAVSAAIRVRFAGPALPATADDLPRWVRQLYANYEINDRLLRAQLNTPTGRSLRAKSQKARDPKLVDMIQASLPAASARASRRLTALINLIAHAPAWVSLHDQWGMNAAEAGEATTWAIRTLLAEARRRPAALDFEEPPAPPA